MVYIGYGIILVTALQLIVKNFIINGFDIYSLLFFEGIFGMIIALLFKWNDSYRDVVYIKNKKDIIFL